MAAPKGKRGAKTLEAPVKTTKTKVKTKVAKKKKKK